MRDRFKNMIIVKHDHLKNMIVKFFLFKKKRLLGNIIFGKFENVVVMRFKKYRCWEFKKYSVGN